MTTKTFAIGVALFAACMEKNPNYQAPGDGSGSSGSDGGSGSGSNQDCTPTSCTGDTPVCDTVTMKCVACSTDAQCGGDTCLPAGGCGSDDVVAYVDAKSGSDAGTCGSASVCKTVTYALTSTTKPNIVLRGDATGDNNGIAIARTVSILGRGSASIETMAAGPVVAITGTIDVGLYDLALSGGATTGSGDCVQTSTTGKVTLEQMSLSGCQRIGVESTAGTVVLDRSEVFMNPQGGVGLTATGFTITNCLIHDNGTTNGASKSLFGGVHVSNSPNPTDTIQFTTIATNHAESNAAGGVICDTESQSLTFSNNIVSGNDVAALAETTGGGCAYTYTDFNPATALQTGTGNIGVDPKLDAMFKLMPGSPAIDAASPTPSIAIDYFGDVRPQGSGWDMGADEF